MKVLAKYLDEDVLRDFVASSDLEVQGTIHILRKHFYSKKLNLTSKFFTKSGFFRQNKTIFFSILHFDEISSEILKFLVCKEEINCSKDS